MTAPWREVARSIHQATRPTATVELLGRRYVVPNRMRTAAADRDYAVLQVLARDKQCVFDVGANLGATALVMSAVMPDDGRVIAFDASESACLNIQQLVELNQLGSRIEVVNAILSDTSGQVMDFYWDHASGGASTVSGYLDHTSPVSKVTLALSDYVRQTGRRPDLVKIDVEGAEATVVAGARELLTEVRPALFVELHSWQGRTVPDNAGLILSQLPDISYQMVYLKTKEIVTNTAAMADRGRCHVLLLPDDSPDWSRLDALNTTGL